MKTCSKCRTEKPLTDFYTDKRKRDGHASQCKECTRAQQNEFQRKYKERHGVWYSKSFVYERTCEHCGTTWTTKSSQSRFCSRTCANAIRSYAKTCEHCGKNWEAQTATARWCSPGCYRMSQYSKELALWTPTPWWVGRRWPIPSRPRRWHAGRCRRCDTPFVSDQPENRYCSRACGRSDSKARRRARKKDAYVSDVYRARIFERDKWTCKLCHRKVNRNAVVPHPRAPVLDHIIPLAAGGTHEPANVQCAHFHCNSVKRDRGGGEQLLLIG